MERSVNLKIKILKGLRRGSRSLDKLTHNPCFLRVVQFSFGLLCMALN